MRQHASPREEAPGSPTGPWLLRGLAELWDGERVVRDAAVVVDGGRFTWVGRDADRPQGLDELDADGAIALPGLVDCHTHTTFAGSRADDFRRRLGGESYASILEGGGGIHSTVRHTRAASEAELAGLTRERLAGMLAGGVTTVEIKSGYGLTLESELAMLRAARAAAGPVDVVTTYLAHVLPPDRPRAAYVDEVVREHLPAARGLADAVDVYCDRGAFTVDEAVRILTAGRELGFHLRVHAEQIERTGIAARAAALGALSADHLEQLDADGVAAMARAGTVAVLLPGAMVYLGDPPPPVAALRAAGVRLAVATDFNPGSSPLRDLLAAATLACLTLKLSVEEALAGVTSVAAAALGAPDRGVVRAGAAADLALYRPPPGEPAQVAVLVQYLGGHRAFSVVKGGRFVTGAFRAGGGAVR